MTEQAVALVFRPDERAPESPATSRRRVGRGGPTGRPGARRSAGASVLAVALLIVGAWLVVVFADALTELNDAEARAAEVRAESVLIEELIAARRDESVLAQSDAFMAMQARAFGMGLPGERPFALEADAPAAPPVVPLGGEAANSGAGTPLEAWLRLLFGD